MILSQIAAEAIGSVLLAKRNQLQENASLLATRRLQLADVQASVDRLTRTNESLQTEIADLQRQLDIARQESS